MLLLNILADFPKSRDFLVRSSIFAHSSFRRAYMAISVVTGPFSSIKASAIVSEPAVFRLYNSVCKVVHILVTSTLSKSLRKSAL